MTTTSPPSSRTWRSTRIGAARPEIFSSVRGYSAPQQAQPSGSASSMSSRFMASRVEVSSPVVFSLRVHPG